MDVRFTLLNENTNFCMGTTNMKSYTNRPLSTRGCTILICNSGKATISINFRKLLFKKGDIIFLFSDMMFILVNSSSDFSTTYCAASSELLNEVTYNIPWGFYEYLYINPVCSTTEEQYSQLILWKQQVEWFTSDNTPGQQHSFIRNSIQNLFFMVDREIKRNLDIFKQTQKKDRAWEFMNKFFILLVKHCKENRNVSFYANELCITPYYLYKITYKIMKLSPKELIDEQIVVEIKMHLSCTNLSVKEIAESLHFEDPSYMCRFFRRHTGMSLTEYKSEFI